MGSQNPITVISIYSITDINHSLDLQRFNIDNFVTRSQHSDFNFTENDHHCFMQVIGSEIDSDFIAENDLILSRKIGGNGEQKTVFSGSTVLSSENNRMLLFAENEFDNEQIFTLISAKNENSFEN